MAETQQPRDGHKGEDRRDKPVEEEGDKDIKEGGIAGARRAERPPRRPSR